MEIIARASSRTSSSCKLIITSIVCRRIVSTSGLHRYLMLNLKPTGTSRPGNMLNNTFLSKTTSYGHSKVSFTPLSTAATGTKEHVDELVKKNKVVVFMKGDPDAPRCGFSNAVVQILRMHGVTYDSHNVLEDENLRQGIKEYSNWPTIPQVYVDGQFIGGCDILLQMHQSGEIIEELKKAGIRSALLDQALEEERKNMDSKKSE
ncbi:glutaredoxin-related protein 5, mitochondrial-like isoform X2 [Limulus polyphemus]|uniref:Glutaredoxin-related protein 5, mitochondrial-like isoform X2 n=1 Tax=Limulus polyphemus TaxID=6850 RepID=A0ABM1B7Q4_LIMPO|nr:glutaredoxin-related protein 5, mitochondrial-like isoform X2 [Limulus polyphemus]